jgi:CheY-like chemotaxis protein
MSTSKTILIVDDDSRNRKLEEALLRADGYAVQSVDSGAAALAAIARTPPDLILLDLMMPGMDGFEVIRGMKADPAMQAIPVILVTALDDAASRARAAAAGVSDVITKPIDRWELKASLDKLLGDPA